MESMRFGVSRASRQMHTRTASRERRMYEVEDIEEADELNAWHEHEDGDNLYDLDPYAGWDSAYPAPPLDLF